MEESTSGQGLFSCTANAQQKETESVGKAQEPQDDAPCWQAPMRVASWGGAEILPRSTMSHSGTELVPAFQRVARMGSEVTDY